MGFENDAKELIEKFRKQFHGSAIPQNNHLENLKEDVKKSTGNQSVDISELIKKNQSGPSNTDQSPVDQKFDNIPINEVSNDTGGTEQGLLKDVEIIRQPDPQTSGTQPVVSSPNTSGISMGNVCSQCKTIHPPIQMGEKCPNAKEDLSDKGLDETNINKFLVDIKNMLISQMNSKGIKDGKKLFQFITIELMKILETYNE
ncbi:MAG: hypothetical protein ACFFG0_01335 [Candidatus Thorarchaeota archaeon]